MIDMNDSEYTWPPGELHPVAELPPLAGPELTRLRLDSIEARVRVVERQQRVRLIARRHTHSKAGGEP